LWRIFWIAGACGDQGLRFLHILREKAPDLSSEVISAALVGASHLQRYHNEYEKVEGVWTGPEVADSHFRQTEQAILEVVDSARDRDRLEAADRSMFIDEVLCNEYFIQTHPNFAVHFWMDPQRNYIVRRKVNYHDEMISLETNIRYRQDAVAGWVPSSWESSYFDHNGNLHTSWEVTVTNLQVNRPIEDSVFDLEFPEGCHVRDQRIGKEFRVLADGTMRELGPRGEELPQPSWYGRNKLYLIGGMFGGIGLYFYLRKRYR
jgi:hypothetical protein